MSFDIPENRPGKTPLFEMLEERLMLTSLVEGEFFVYYNLQQEAIRVDLNDYDPDTFAAVELFSYVGGDGGPDLGVTDVVGIKNGGGSYAPISPQSVGQAGVVNWPDGEGVIEFPDGGGVQWNQSPNAGRHPPTTEVYSVYVAAASDSTYLTFTNLTESPQNWTDAGWMNALDPFGGTENSDPRRGIALDGAGGANVGLSVRVPGVPDPADHPTTMDLNDFTIEVLADDWGFAPAGTAIIAGVTVSENAYSGYSTNFQGGVNIDAMTSVWDELFEQTILYAVEEPFGSLGISDNSEVGLGENDAPVPNMDYDWIMDALVADDFGNYYAIDSDLRANIAPEVGYDEDDNGIREADAWSLVEDGDTARALALSDGGTFYYMQEGADLRHITRDGLLDISGDPGGDITSLSFWHNAGNPADPNDNAELLYGVYAGQNGGMLVTIGNPEDATGLTEVPVVNIMPFDDDSNGTVEEAEGVGYLDLELIAWPEDPLATSDADAGRAGDQLYGVTAANQLYLIDPDQASPPPPAGDGNVYAYAYSAPVALDRAYEDITCIGGQLYGATGDEIYLIDAATGASTFVASPMDMLKQQVKDLPGVNAGNSQMSGIAYHDGDSGEHGALWVVYQLPDPADGRVRPDNPVEYHLVRVDLGGVIEPVDTADGSTEPRTPDGVSSPWGIAEQYDIGGYFQDELPPVVSGLAAPTEIPPDVPESYAYRQIRAAAYDGTTYYAVATIFDMDRTVDDNGDGDLDDTGDYALITIDPDTGVATWVGELTDFVTALEFDDAGNLYGADSTGDIQGINAATGAFTGSVNNGFVGMTGTVEGLSYVNANGTNIGMLALFSPDPGTSFQDYDQIWAVNLGGAGVELLYDNDQVADNENDTVMRDGLTSLAYCDSFADGDFLWSTAPGRSDDGVFRLQRLPITAMLVQAAGDSPTETVLGPLYEPGSGLPVAEVTGLDDAIDVWPAGLDPWLWAVGKEADLNPWAGNAPGSPVIIPDEPVDPAAPAPNVIADGASIMELDPLPFFGSAVIQFHTLYDDVMDDGTAVTDPDIFTNVTSLAFLPQDLDPDEPPVDIMYIVAEDPDFPGTYNIYDIEYSPVLAEVRETGFLRDDNDVDNFATATLGAPETGPYDVVELVAGIRQEFTGEVTGMDFAYNAVDPLNDFFESYAVAVDLVGDSFLYEVEFDDTLNDALMRPFGELEDDPDREFSSMGITMDRWIEDEHDFVDIWGTVLDFEPGLTFFCSYENAAGTGTTMLGQRLGALKVAGRLRHEFTAYNSVRIIDVGVLNANVTIEGNLGTLISRTGSDGNSDFNLGNSTIDVAGTIGMVDSRTVEGATFSSAVIARGDRSIYETDDDLFELEVAVIPPDPNFDPAWRGEALPLVLFDDFYGIFPYRILPDYSNDTMDTAQFLSHPSGTFTITGSLDAPAHIPNAEPDTVDYYALPLKAGQTIMLEENEDNPFTYGMSPPVRLYSPFRVDDSGQRFNTWLDSWGYETEEDWGIGSVGMTPEPMIFTAPEAGVYYLEVTAPLMPIGYSYTITNGPAKALGAVRVEGDYNAAIGNSFSYVDDTESVAFGYEIAAERGGIGAFVCTSGSYGALIGSFGGSDNAPLGAFREGGIVAVEAGTIGPLIGGAYTTNTIDSDSHIGRVASTLPESEDEGGWIDAGITAGSLVYNEDAHIQNIYSAQDYIFLNNIYATGSIGVIETMGDLLGGVWINVNTDRTGPAGNLDLIRVHGDYGSLDTGVPRLEHNEGGNIRFVQVDGDIITQSESTGWIAPQGEISVPNMSSVTLADDGGGTLELNPSGVPVLDQDGNQIYVDEDGNQVEDESGTPLYQNTVYSYITIPVYVNGSASGAGAVIANLRVDGRANITTTGRVEISDMLINATEFIPEDHDVTLTDQPYTYGGVRLSGTNNGQYDVYYLHDEGLGPLRENNGDIEQEVFTTNWIPYFRNNTNGTIVSGRLSGGIGTITVGGDIGPGQTNSTGAWLPGHDLAPVSAGEVTEPQYGWFHGTLNGLDIGTTGDDGGGGGGGAAEVIDRPALGRLTAAGAIHDLRIVGEAGPIEADSDNLHLKSGNWDGVGGIIWSSERLEYVDVGEGLADDGSGALAEAAIMSTGTIGTVYIDAHGETYSVLPMGDDPNENLKLPKVYGMINGTIASADAFIELDDEGNRVYRNNIDLVRGVNGATMTANVYSGDLTVFRCNAGGALPGGGIGTVLFTGTGAAIDGSEIHGAWVERVATDTAADGIFNTTVIGNSVGLSSTGDAVGIVEGGGVGIINSRIYSNGGHIGTVRGLGGTADLVNCFIESEGGDIDLISARDIRTDWATITFNPMMISTGAGTAHRVNASRDMFGVTFTCGAVGTVTVGRDMRETTFDVAARIGTIRVGGAMIDSIVDLEGPYGSELGSLVVIEDISGSITCAGSIGTIISRQGEIRANIRTVATTDDFSSDVGRIEAEEGYTGTLNLVGSLGRFISHASLGDNPANTGITQFFNILGDLDYLYVWSRNGEPVAHLYADIAVGGNLGKVKIEGDLLGNLYVNGDLGVFDIDGALGDEINTTQDWTGVNGAPWPGIWSIEGDTDQVASVRIWNNRGRLLGIDAAVGEAFAMAPNACEDSTVAVDFNIGTNGMGFGLVSRRSDADNDTYYEASVIPGSQNLGIYRVVDGARTLLLDTGFGAGAGEVVPGTDYRLEFSTRKSLAGGTDLAVTLRDQFGAVLATGTFNDNHAALQDRDGRFGMYYVLVPETVPNDNHVDVDNFDATFSRAGLYVAGDIRSMRFGQDRDILADLTFGGGVNRISLRNGDIVGDITCLFGELRTVTVIGGNILGDITAPEIRNITVRSRTVLGVEQGGTVSGDITVTEGDLRVLNVIGGDISGDVTVLNGMLWRLGLRGSRDDISELAAGSRIYAAAGFRSVVFNNADVNGDIVSGLDMRNVRVNGDVTGRLYAETGMRSVNIRGAFSGILRAGGEINRVSAGSLDGAVVSAGWNIRSVLIRGDVDSSMILAGADYNTGFDGVPGTADDSPIVNNASSGDISRVNVAGSVTDTVIAAGVNPVDGDYYTVGDNTPAPGMSSIRRISVRGGFNTAVDGNLVTADTDVDDRFTALFALDPDLTVDELNAFPAAPIGWTLINRDFPYDAGGLSVRLNVGTAYINPAADTIYLEDTTSRSSLIISGAHAGLNITDTIPGDTSDDESLRQLRVDDNVLLDNVTIDGDVRILRVDRVALGAVWTMPGEVTNVLIGSSIDNLTADMGAVNSFRVRGSYAGGALRADSLRRFHVDGRMAADLTTDRGDLSTATIRGGSLTGDLTSHGDMRRLFIADNLAGDVTVEHGDLLNVQAARAEGGNVDVDGAVRGAVFRLGDFGTALTPNTSFRAGRGVNSFTVRQGDLQGLVSTDGDLRRLFVRGAMKGRARALGDIMNVRFGSMEDAILTAGGDLRSVRIGADMNNGYIFAGFDPGDAGAAAGTEAREVTIDIPVTQTETKLRKIPEAGQEDEVRAGDIRIVRVGGQMGRSINEFGVLEYGGFAIGAGVGPGEDGWIGTADDVVAATGEIGRVIVGRGIYGTWDNTQHFGVYAASSEPDVRIFGNQPAEATGNVGFGSYESGAGPFKIVEVNQSHDDELTVRFNHAVNFGTVDTLLLDPAEPVTFQLLVSPDTIFGDANDESITDDPDGIYNTQVSYDDLNQSIVVLLGNTYDWDAVADRIRNENGLLDTDPIHFQLTVDDAVTDTRSRALDGEYYGSMPTGNGVDGGDFVYEFEL